MKVLLTSDWHIEEGIYTSICINYIDYLVHYCNANNIKDIVIAGDVFEKSSKIKNEAFLPIFFKMMELKDDGYNLYFLLGNHDIYNVDNASLVEAFVPFGKVFKKYEEINIGGRTFSFLPYTKNENDIPNSGDVLITHLSIADFYFDNKYHVNEKAGFSINMFNDWNIVFSGHFHKPQNQKNIVYIGSPYQMNFGEIGQEKGFVVFDTKSNEWKREIYEDAPKYIRIKANDFTNVNVFNCFVEVEIEEKIDNYIQLKHILYEKGALEVVPSFKNNENSEMDVDENIELALNKGIADMMVEYINNLTVKEGIKKEKLLEIFDKIIDVI